MRVTDWSSVEFANTTSKSRKAQDVLPMMTDLIAVWDFFTCLVAGQAALSLYLHYVTGTPLALFAAGPFRRDIIFGSIIATLVLRNPADLLEMRSQSRWRLILKAEQRCCGAFGLLIVVGMVTGATNDLARLWLISWLTLFGLSVACTRAVYGHYVNRLNGRGELRESIAIIGATGARDRLAARIADEAKNDEAMARVAEAEELARRYYACMVLGNRVMLSAAEIIEAQSQFRSDRSD